MSECRIRRSYFTRNLRSNVANDQPGNRVSQRNNNDLTVLLADDLSTRYPAIAAPDAPPFNVLLQPNEDVKTVRRFHVPQDAKGLRLIVGPQRWLPIIGREPFQKTVVLLT